MLIFVLLLSYSIAINYTIYCKIKKGFKNIVLWLYHEKSKTFRQLFRETIKLIKNMNTKYCDHIEFFSRVEKSGNLLLFYIVFINFWDFSEIKL